MEEPDRLAAALCNQRIGIHSPRALERSAAQTRNETLALAAHELKTPLAIIKGCATTLLGSSTRWDPSTLREMLQMIDTQAVMAECQRVAKGVKP